MLVHLSCSSCPLCYQLQRGPFQGWNQSGVSSSIALALRVIRGAFRTARLEFCGGDKNQIDETSTRRTGGAGGGITIGREQSASPSLLAAVGLDLCMTDRALGVNETEMRAPRLDSFWRNRANEAISAKVARTA